MALAISSISSSLFSADFPDINITGATANVSVTVTVAAGSTNLLSTSYYPVSNAVCVRGVNELINEYMTANSVQTSTITITATQGTDTVTTSTTAIYSRYHISGITAANFISKHFLRRGEVSQTTRTATETLRYYCSAAYTETMTIVATSDDGTVQTKTVTTARTGGVVSIDASYTTMLAKFTDFTSIVCYRISIDDKVAFYYVIDTPMYEFSFRNMFGYTEVCRLSGVFTKNFTTEKSFAVCNGKRMQYDVSHEMTMTVTSSAMNLLDLEIFVDMATSDSVTYLGEKALIVDYECNPTTQNGTINSISVEFEFENSMLTAYISDEGHTFTDEFTNQYC